MTQLMTSDNPTTFVMTKVTTLTNFFCWKEDIFSKLPVLLVWWGYSEARRSNGRQSTRASVGRVEHNCCVLLCSWWSWLGQDNWWLRGGCLFASRAEHLPKWLRHWGGLESQQSWPLCSGLSMFCLVWAVEPMPWYWWCCGNRLCSCFQGSGQHLPCSGCSGGGKQERHMLRY